MYGGDCSHRQDRVGVTLTRSDQEKQEKKKDEKTEEEEYKWNKENDEKATPSLLRNTSQWCSRVGGGRYTITKVIKNFLWSGGGKHFTDCQEEGTDTLNLGFNMSSCSCSWSFSSASPRSCSWYIMLLQYKALIQKNFSHLCYECNASEIALFSLGRGLSISGWKILFQR